MNNLLINNPAKGPGAKIYFCKVIRFLPSSNTADVVTIDNNISLLGCNIACSMPAGFFYGARYIPTHDDANPEVEYVNSPGDIYCVAAFLENDYNNSAILGFLFPMETTLSIAEYGLYIFRHESDVMWMVRGDGTMQVYHPSGSIIKIGDDNSNEMTDNRETGGLYPAKTDGLYIRPSADYNAQKQSNLFIDWYQGQKVTLNSAGEIILQTRDAAATITMTPDGKVTVQTTEQINAITKDINITASGSVVANVDGNVTANVEGDLDIQAENATVIAAGTVDVTSGAIANISGFAGVNITSATGNVNITSPLGNILVRAPAPGHRVQIGGPAAGGPAPTNNFYQFV
jgi:hypothetical protein